MSPFRIIYDILEMILFVIASVYVVTEYVRSDDVLAAGFVLFLLLMFVVHVIRDSEVHTPKPLRPGVKK